MLLFPNGKINLGLQVTGKREDGFHDIASVFLPIPWQDALEIIEAPELTLQVSGNTIPGDAKKNLCILAWNLLKADFPQLPPVSIYLHKTVPAGAGLGGGSSNGAFMLKALNNQFKLGISTARLIKYALQLGSDCPFFIQNTPALATSRGEILDPIKLHLTGNWLILINPGIHVNTGWAFNQIQPAALQVDLKEIMQLSPSEWETAGLKNIFQQPVFTHFPEIATAHKMLVHAGATYAAMSGSGSTCFGLFTTEPSINKKSMPQSWIFQQWQL